MNLHQYLQSDGAPTLSSVAASIGVTVGRLSQLRRSANWPPALALKVERATDGELDAGLLSPVIADARRSIAV